MKFFKQLTIASMLVAAPAAMAASETFTSSIEVIAPVSITKTADLDFGTILADETANVTVAAADAGAAAFTITGNAGDTVTVTVDNTATMTDGSNNIGVISIAPDDAAPVLTGGSATVKVGGVADIATAGTLVAGSYTGNVNIDVVYQ